MLKLKEDFRNVKYELCIKLNISERTLDNWIDTQRGAKFSIPSDALIFIADYFSCNVTELING